MNRAYDSHCHLDYEALRADLVGAGERARRAGVERVLVPGVDPAQWARAEALQSSQLELRFAVGLHPQVLHERSATERALDAMPEWIARLGAVAIGELGWDAIHARERGVALEDALAEQSRVAGAQLELARARGLPVIVHVVGAHALALEQLARHAPLRGVVHSYSGSAELVARSVALGVSISVGPSVTRSRAKKPLLAARAVPDAHLLVETDAPEQRVEQAEGASEGGRAAGADRAEGANRPERREARQADQYPEGKPSRRGEVADVLDVIAAVARARGASTGTVSKLTFDNAARLFT
ncbi:MAG: TatD family hydrolase [Sandaracinaceae bacterium]|nr:TatD family hydrolase [Sandaracinaceae bacterium]